MRRRVLAVLAAAVPRAALAAGAGGGALPWDNAFRTLMNDLTGGTAGVLAVLGVFAAGLALLFGGEMGWFVRTLVFIVFVASLVALAPNVLQALGIAGAALT